MAYVNKKVAGRDIEDWIAYQKPVHDALKRKNKAIAGRAKVLLAQHHHEGDAYIATEHGKLDYYTVLNDTRGQKAAMSIEYGRHPDAEGNGGMEGLFILRRAAFNGADPEEEV